MLTSTLSSLLTLSALTLASPLQPQARQIAIPSAWTWSVSEWEAGCGRNYCSYIFNITVPSVHENGVDIAGVKAECSGGLSDQKFQACKILEGVNNGVAATFVDPREGLAPANIAVSFLYAGFEDRPSYNFSGKHEAIHNAAVAPLQTFEICPTEVFGVV
ncbi:hypothetical protein BCR34DRAFT_610295 [Clohesyomyces aquaticus]|uniref:Uncharacterized protein n=1 Tax=Clohesyomyces aquaticus TaxID=1231657 RepID=A0A1Y2A8L1_9PLEO|nr:hypothetical protein BCR34DRAFT_610295 [Clohesyomyces aquaticus]